MIEHDRKIAVIGLGYVGLAVAIGFGHVTNVIGFDINPVRIKELSKHYDRHGDFTTAELNAVNITYTTDPHLLQQADFFIVAVPTPLNSVKHPDFSMLVSASTIVGQHLKRGDIVVYESTVYPGATEEVCIPTLEQVSKLRCGSDFKVGYSPERINPSDKKHTFSNIKKIVSGQDAETLDIIAKTYAKVVKAGIYRVSSIKVAEAAKVIENTQRDLNISLINEIALILHKMGIDTHEVLAAASTKWNFLPFQPGLVGGHCIGVDPYYLTHKAQELGYYPDVILAGRRINDLMGKFIAEQTIKQLIQLGTPIKRARIAVLGITFKENCPDIRNTRVVDVIEELKSYDVEVLVHDPYALPDEVKKEYGLELVDLAKIADVDAIIIAVAHQQYTQLTANTLKELLNNRGLIMDVKSILAPEAFADTGIRLWRL